MKTTFIYNANALALAGKITRPVERDVRVNAISELAKEGGYHSARHDKYRLDELISFDAAYTHVSGSQNPKDGSYTSLSSATIEGLNVLDIVTADRVVAQIATEHHPKPAEPKIVPLGTRIENLRIAGKPITVDFDHDMFNTLCTYSEFHDKYARSGKFREEAKARFGWAPAKAKRAPETDGEICCSLTRDVAGLDSSMERNGYRVRIPHFGTITFGEIFISQKKRKLVAMRFDLGSPVEGVLSVGEVDGNGTTFP